MVFALDPRYSPKNSGFGEGVMIGWMLGMITMVVVAAISAYLKSDDDNCRGKIREVHTYHNGKCILD